MEQPQDDITTMFETTLAFLEKFKNIWKNRPAFLRAVTSAQAGTAEIRGRSGKQQAPTEGVTGDKEQVRDALEEKLSVVADALAALADETKNAELAAKVELNRSVIDRLSASDLNLAAKRVLEATAENLAALADYGITATEQTDLAGAAELFANKKEKPREAIVGRRVETLSLPEAIDTVRSIFRNRIDKMMTGFKRTEPDFYKGYVASRVIVNHAATIPKKPAPPPTPPPGP
jgi:vacuolar-type H+-ATPase subunit I/STV1